MIDQGSRIEIMDPNLYKSLGLKLEDLTKYDIPLVGFDGKVVVPKGQISLPVLTKGNEVMENFKVVDFFHHTRQSLVHLGFMPWEWYPPHFI